MSEVNKAVHVIISGRVQGVSYRAWTKSNARKRRLNGWVRNLRDGTVEAVFSGAEEKVDAMLTDCKNGPLACRVTHIEAQPFTEAVQDGFEAKETV